MMGASGKRRSRGDPPMLVCQLITQDGHFSLIRDGAVEPSNDGIRHARNSGNDDNCRVSRGQDDLADVGEARGVAKAPAAEFHDREGGRGWAARIFT